MLTSGNQIGGGIGVNFANLWPLSQSFFVLFLYGFTKTPTFSLLLVQGIGFPGCKESLKLPTPQLSLEGIPGKSRTL